MKHLDDAVGRLLDSLDRLGLAERTIVLFTSDNGGRGVDISDNAPLRGDKGNVYEGGIREPLLIRWPGVTEPGSVCSVPVVSTDFYPTLLDMAGIPLRPEQHRDGVSIAALCRGGTALDRPAIFWHHPHYSTTAVPASAIRQGDWKLVKFYSDYQRVWQPDGQGGGKVVETRDPALLQLYNLRDDLGEQHDLARKLPEKTAELHRLLMEHLRGTEARLPVKNPDYDPSKTGNRHLQDVTSADRSPQLKATAMNRLPAILAAAVALLSAAVPARAEVPETFRKLWSDPQVVARIDRDTEQYRKADAVIELVDAQGKPVGGAKIAAVQQTHEFLFGCNLFVLDQLATPELNAKYEKAFTHLFNFATVPFYWGDLEPEQGKPRYADGLPYVWRRPPPDVLVAWCKAHGITPKGHALLYAKNMFMPKWTVCDDAAAFMEQASVHVTQLAERYGRQIPVWDVINEEIPRVAHPDQWHAVPEDYAERCFRQATGLFSKDATLIINDGTTQTHVTTDLCEANVKRLLDAGIRVDGIGIQFHAGRGAVLNGKPYSPQHLIDVYDRLGRLGRSLWITEITISGTGADGPAEQAAAVEALYRLWFSTPKMAGITWWNLGDGTGLRQRKQGAGRTGRREHGPQAGLQGAGPTDQPPVEDPRRRHHRGRRPLGLPRFQGRLPGDRPARRPYAAVRPDRDDRRRATQAARTERAQRLIPTPTIPPAFQGARL